MQIYSKLKQYYRYLRNLKKLRSRKYNVRNCGQEVEFYSQFIKPNELCFDIGANVGDKSEVFLKTGAKVVAVEPQESCWRILKHRFRNHNLFIEAKAVADKEGESILFVDRSPTISSMSKDWISAVKKSGRFSTHKWAYKITVKTTTLDALIEKYGRPVFCKIDVEGAEWEALKGLSQPLKLISFEFVSERIQAALSCINYLSKLGATEFNYCQGDNVSFALPNWVSHSQMRSVLTTMNKDIYNFGDIYVRFKRDRTGLGNQ